MPRRKRLGILRKHQIKLLKLQIKILNELMNDVDKIVGKYAKGILSIELKAFSINIKKMLETQIIMKNRKLQRLLE